MWHVLSLDGYHRLQMRKDIAKWDLRETEKSFQSWINVRDHKYIENHRNTFLLRVEHGEESLRLQRAGFTSKSEVNEQWQRYWYVHCLQEIPKNHCHSKALNANLLFFKALADHLPERVRHRLLCYAKYSTKPKTLSHEEPTEKNREVLLQNTANANRDWIFFRPIQVHPFLHVWMELKSHLQKLQKKTHQRLHLSTQKQSCHAHCPVAEPHPKHDKKIPRNQRSIWQQNNQWAAVGKKKKKAHTL